MKYVKFLAVFSLLAVIVPNLVSAATSAEIQAQINALMTQIKQLQEQLAQLQSQPVAWCHDFNVNLKVGDSGDEVKALKIALVKDGIEVNSETIVFDEYTASAVSGFQQKYKSEILTPLGLNYGTGFVGKSTRAKLNQLYGCGVQTQPSITVLSPNGGESWKAGQTYNIQWTSQNLPMGNNIIISIIQSDTKIATMLFSNVGNDKNVMSWTIPLNISLGSYVMNISAPALAGKVGDSTDAPFSIVAATTNLTCADSTKPSGNPPSPWWSPRPTTAQQYIDAVCGNGSSDYQAWCLWLKPRTQCVPSSYYTPVTTQPSITVLSPNGGEQWVKGTTQTINWILPNGPFTSISVFLHTPDWSKSYSIGKFSGNTVAYGWTVGQVLDSAFISSGVPLGNYVIRVTGVDAKGTEIAFDGSDAPFSIVAAVSLPAAILTSPSGTITTSAPAYAWNAVNGSTWYNLWVDDSATLAAKSGKIRQWYKASEAGCASGTGACSVTAFTPHSFTGTDAKGVVQTGYVNLAQSSAKWYIQTYSETLGYGPWSSAMDFNVAANTAVSCPLSVSGSPVVYNSGQLTWRLTSNPAGYKIKWYGTKNGVQDENGRDYNQYTDLNWTDGPWTNSSVVGNYTRYFKAFDSSGNVVCTSNTVNTSIVAAGTGPLGSKTNPIKLNQVCGNTQCAGSGGYTFSGGERYAIPSNSRVYFEVDPKTYSGISYAMFSMSVKGYNNEHLRFYYFVTDKTGNVLKSETEISQNYSLGHNVFNNQPYKIDDVKYIYGVANEYDWGSGIPSANIDVWWTGSTGVSTVTNSSQTASVLESIKSALDQIQAAINGLKNR